MQYITLVELRNMKYKNKKALINFVSGRVSTVDHLSKASIGYLPKSMYSIKGCIRALQERIISANNNKPSWVRYIPTWEEHIEFLESLKTEKSEHHS